MPPPESFQLSIMASWAAIALTATPALGQLELIPDAAPDRSLNTQVIQNALPSGDVITGGARSQNGQNLFHSFQEFNIQENRGVYFQNPTGVQNILTRVTGRDPSDILGTLGVLGSANLFFLNPNGIFFGPNAHLQISGSFFASTANSFRFPDGSEFSAVNPQAPPLLTLNITPGLQTGTIAPNSTITNRGNLAAGQDLILESDRLELQGQVQAGRDLTLQAQNTVQIQDTIAHPFIAQAGRSLSVQGDRAVIIDALNHPHSGLTSGGDLLLRSNTPIQGDAHYNSGGNFRIETLTHTPGRLFSPRDPVIRAQGDVSFDGYTGASLHILAGGSVIVPGLIEILSPDGVNGLTEAISLSDGRNVLIDGRIIPTLDIRAGTTSIGTGTTESTAGFDSPPILGVTPTTADIQIGTIFTPIAQEGMVLLTNQYRPNTLNGSIQVNRIDASVNEFFVNGGSVFIDSRNDITISDTLDTFAQFGNGGQVVLLANGDINTRNINAATTTILSGNGGAVMLHSRNGNIITDGVRTDGGLFGAGGAIRLTSNTGGITIRPNSRINSATYGSDPGGNVTLTSRSVDLAPGTSLLTTSFGDGAAGNIEIAAPSITVTNGQLLAIASQAGNAGTLTLDAGTTGTVTLRDRSIGSTLTVGTGTAGDITITAGNLIVENSNLATATIDAADLGISGITGGGRGGNLRVNAAESVQVRNTLGDTTFDFDIDLGTGGVQTITAPVGLTSRTQSAGDAGEIRIDTRRLSVEGGASISTSTGKQAQAGNMIVNATESVDLLGTSRNSEISSGLFSEADSDSTGNAGTIQLTTGRLTIRDGAAISTSASQNTQGQGGDLIVGADTVELSGTSPSNLTRSALLTATIGAGDAGNLQVSTRQLRMLNGAIVSTSTLDQGRSGNLTIQAAELVEVSGTATDNLPTTLATGTGGTGVAGTLIVQTGRLVVRDGGLISAATYDRGIGGNITIAASESVELTGRAADGRPAGVVAGSGIQGYSQVLNRLLNSFQINKQIDTANASGAGGSIQIATHSLTVQAGATLSTETIGVGAGGNIQVEANTLILNQGGQISARTTGSGRAGNIEANVRDQVTATDSGSGIFVNTLGGFGGTIALSTNELQLANGASLNATTSASSTGGNIQVQANILNATTGGQIRTTTSGSGNAGGILLQITDRVTLSGQDTGLFASTTPGSTGNGGNIIIDPRLVQIDDGATIAVNSQGSGTGGSISLQAGRLELSDRGSITAETASAQGGNITLDVQDLILLRRNSLISATAGTGQTVGDGGNINIRASFIIGVLGENSDITANAFTGRGGNISITTNAIYGLRSQPQLTPFSDITASSQFGLSGSIAINTLNVDPNRGLVALPTNFTDPSRQISQGCSPPNSNSARIGRFVVTGRGGAPASPEAALTGNRPLVDLVSPIPSNSTQATSSQVLPVDAADSEQMAIVEAQTWTTGKDGTVFLTAYTNVDSVHAPGIPLPTCISR